MGGFDPKQLQSLMSQAKKQYEGLQQKMRETVVEATAGGGSVRVRMNGQKQVLAIKIEADVVQSGDVEMLQDLVTAAVNEAGRKVDQEMQGALGGMMGGLGNLGL
jgi:DNA-binding YbaB/EbfC family protein